MNKPENPKEKNLIKGAIRRVFSRSELRREAVNRTLAPEYSNSERPRVKRWCLCPLCKTFTPYSYMQVDHVQPIIGLQESLSDISWDELVSRIWCDQNNLMAICIDCHKAKSKVENANRRKANKERKK